MKLTRHNGRSGKDGAFTARHNDRTFNLQNAEHIDSCRTENNVYWDRYNGVRTFSDTVQEEELTETFDEIEKRFYNENYQTYVQAQNERNAKNRHLERNRTVEDIRRDRKTCPEESIYQIGTMQDHTSPEVLLEIATEFMDTMEERYGSHVHILDWALHVDEATPHIHERHVFDCLNRYGELIPQQENALEDLGFDLPYPDRKPGRYNNRKMAFDSACRQLLFDIAKRHNLILEEEPSYGSRTHVEKEEFIFQQQQKKIKEQNEIIHTLQEEIYSNNADIATQEDKLNILEMKVDDVQELISEVSEIAYDKAIGVVAEVACTETQKENTKIINEFKDFLTQPDRNASRSTRSYAVKCLNSILRKFKKATAKILENVKENLFSQDFRKQRVAEIEEDARESVIKKIEKYKREAVDLNEKQDFIIEPEEHVL